MSKWLLCATCCPPSQNNSYLFDNIGKGLDVFSTDKRATLAGDFNAQVGNKSFETFLRQTCLHKYGTQALRTLAA